MSRDVTLDATGPRYLDEEDIDPEKGDIAVCQCGLSAEFPFCDGSHRTTENEGDGVYRYVDGERRRVASVTFADGETIEYDLPEKGDGKDGKERDEASGEDTT